MYGSWDAIPDEAREFIHSLLQNGNYEHIYAEVVAEEQRAQNSLIEFEQDHSGAANENNAAGILAKMKGKRAGRISILEQLEKIGDIQKCNYENDDLDL